MNFGELATGRLPSLVERRPMKRAARKAEQQTVLAPTVAVLQAATRRLRYDGWRAHRAIETLNLDGHRFYGQVMRRRKKPVASRHRRG